MINQTTNEEELLERLAAIEHEQWRRWSEQIAISEKISEERLARWRGLWISYSTLSEESKEQDRVWARKVLDLLSDFYAKKHTVRKGDIVEVAWYDASYDDKIRTSTLTNQPKYEYEYGTVQICVRIDADLLQHFKQAVLRKYRKLYGTFQREMNIAIEHRLNEMKISSQNGESQQ